MYDQTEEGTPVGSIKIDTSKGEKKLFTGANSHLQQAGVRKWFIRERIGAGFDSRFLFPGIHGNGVKICLYGSD